MRRRRKVLHDVRVYYTRLPHRRRRVSASADKAWHAGTDDATDRRDVAVLDGRESGLLGSAVWRI